MLLPIRQQVWGGDSLIKIIASTTAARSKDAIFTRRIFFGKIVAITIYDALSTDFNPIRF